MNLDCGNCYCDPYHRTAPGECGALREAKMAPAARREEYLEVIRRRQLTANGGSTTDVPYKLQKLGVPTENVIAVRQPSQSKCLDFAKKFITASRATTRTLMYVGLRGCGKSTGATWVLADAVKHHEWNSQPSGGKNREPFVWCHAAEITRETDYGKVNPEWLDGLRACRLLVVDDLGKDGSAAGLVALRDVLTHRHEKQSATVITSNLAPEDFKARYGESWYERLKTAALVPDLRGEKSLRKPRGLQP